MTMQTDSFLFFISIAAAVLASIGIYFFIITRISIIVQSRSVKSDPDTAHIYWIYKSPFFISLMDRMFVVSSILLLQYNKLVSCVVKRLNPSLKGKRILQISCAFGNISEKIAERCAEQGAAEFVLTDIMQSEVDNAQKKLKKFGKLCTFLKQDATKLEFEDQSFDYVVVFFLPHELPFAKKGMLIEEANRVLKPGGKIVFGEFHKPRLKVLEILGRIYFYVFEPYATEMWDEFDIVKALEEKTGNHYIIEKNTFLFDNFQVVAAERPQFQNQA
ncbi:MAG: class I SAM-dependent methyltransferase [Proteobacteria bacterium]|nr:class I SAM-dependent methyltransferase [Pseudomonadota bacterium]